MFISQCTNKRLQILEKEIQKKLTMTDYFEIMVVTGVMLVMFYDVQTRTAIDQRVTLQLKMQCRAILTIY